MKILPALLLSTIFFSCNTKKDKIKNLEARITYIDAQANDIQYNYYKKIHGMSQDEMVKYTHSSGTSDSLYTLQKQKDSLLIEIKYLKDE